MQEAGNQDLGQLYRNQFGRMVTALVSRFGFAEVAVAEDIVQDTFLAAMETWNAGPPQEPEAWLFKVCKNKALNYLNRASMQQRHQSVLERTAITESYRLNLVFQSEEIEDNQLRLLFACCHPKLSNRAQIILTLRMLAGFKYSEIAAGLGMTEAAVKKAASRTKTKIREENLQLRLPFNLRLESRVETVRKVIYLIYNEGYFASSGGRHIRQELCQEAIRLAQSLLNLKKGNAPDTHALLALMLFGAARFKARQSPDGSLITLQDQDRSQWDQHLIRAGMYHLREARQARELSPYHLEAGIAAIHSTAPNFESTDWPQLVSMYSQHYQLTENPYSRFNRALALSQCEGPERAIGELQAPDLKTQLQEYAPYHIALGQLFHQTHDYRQAETHYQTGLDLSRQDHLREHVLVKLNQIREAGHHNSSS